MELRHLRYFIAVAEELSFTRAAERLHTVQSSLSEQIRNLEIEIGVTLLLRTRRKVELTGAGQVFLEEARLVLRQVGEALARTRKAAQQASETLTIGFVPSAEVWVFPRVLAALRMRFPNLNIVLRSLTTVELEAALWSGEIDIAFMRPVLHGRHLGMDLHRETVLIEPIHIYVHVDHPLADSICIAPQQLQTVPLIGVDPGYSPLLDNLIRSWLARHGVTPVVAQISSNVLMSMNLVASGVGYAMLPAYADSFCPKTVVSRPSADGEPCIELVMAVSQEKQAGSEAARAVMQLVRDLPGIPDMIVYSAG